MLYYIATGLLLLINAIQDIKSKTVRNGGLLVGAGAVCLLLAADGVFSGISANMLLSAGAPWKRLWGVLPGILVLVFSCLSRESIGKGDGYLLCITGAALGFEQSMAVLLFGVLLAGICAGILLSLRKVKRDTKLPFVPFLFAGFLLSLFLTAG